MNKQNISNQKAWRGVKQLLATFLCLGLIAVSCKKKDNLLGANVLPDGTVLHTDAVDTFSLITSTISEDSISSLNPNYNLLGSYVDPVFGPVNASFYTQIDITSLDPVFGDNIIIDSFVFSMVYGGYYGNLDDQTVEVYQLTEDMDLADDETYYSDDNLMYDATNLVSLNTGTFTPRPTTESIVDGDSTVPQLRISLDTNLAKTFINEAKNGTSFSSSENFQDYFKGLYITTNNPSQAVDEGGILYFANTDADSKLTIYYRELVNGSYQSFTYSFLISGDEIDFNNFSTNLTGTNVENVIQNPSEGMYEYYAQAFTSRAKIEIPSLSDIPYGAIVQEATLIIPISYYDTDLKNPSRFLSILSDLGIEGEDLSVAANVVTYNNDIKAYSIDLRNYVQGIITGEYENNGLLLSPTFFNTTAERIIFNGPLTTNKKKPTLNILITDN